MINTKSAGHFQTFLKTFVAPVDPEPIVLRSIFLRYFPIKKPVGSDPKRYLVKIIKIFMKLSLVQDHRKFHYLNQQMQSKMGIEVLEFQQRFLLHQ